MPNLNVFVSHVSEERELAEYLQKRLSEDFLKFVQVFVSSDGESIQAGDHWLDSIDAALRRAKILLVLCSPASIQRPWINFEAGAAWMRKITIIPVCHSGLKPSKLPMPLSILHAVEAGEASGLERLYSRIAALLKSDVPKTDFAGLAEEVRKIETEHAKNANSSPPNTLVTQGLMSQYSPVQQAIDEARLGWTLCFIGEDQSDKLAVLTEDLRRDFSDSGDGKQFASGFSYWGIGPALAWARACNDPFYLVMKNSIESFPARWDRVKSQLTEPYHYVSLGVGTGSKDRKILRDLSQKKPDLYYFPVDMSPEMLRVGIKGCLRNDAIPRSRLLPIQIDFSIETNVDELRHVLTRMVGEEGILYSLLGNTLANFETDTELLRTLTVLLRPQDRLLLEVASTERIDDDAVSAAGEEYAKSMAFKQFVTSALLQYTDLPAGLETLSFGSAREKDRAILVKVIYHNRGNHTVSMKLPDNTTIDFGVNDTIRLLITRKYTDEGIEKLIADCGLSALARTRSKKSRDGFSLDLVMLETSRASRLREDSKS